MEYNERLTNHIVYENTTFYSSKFDYAFCLKRLGQYEDFGLSPLELAETLIKYELQKPRTQWEMDKIEKWQLIIQHIKKQR